MGPRHQTGHEPWVGCHGHWQWVPELALKRKQLCLPLQNRGAKMLARCGRKLATAVGGRGYPFGLALRAALSSDYVPSPGKPLDIDQQSRVIKFRSTDGEEVSQFRTRSLFGSCFVHPTRATTTPRPPPRPSTPPA